MRKTSHITIQDEGRDKGKVFVLTEKSAIEADKWGIRALLALSKSGVPIPPEFMEMGIIGVLAVGIHRLAGVSFGDLEPLLDEMLTCVEIMPTPGRPDVIRKLTAGRHRGSEDAADASNGSVPASHGFFAARQSTGIPQSFGGREPLKYPNISPAIGAVISSRLATLVELSTVLSTEDVYLLVEIIAVDRYNSRPQ